MTFTISTENIYLIVIIVLMALQVYQFILIKKINKEIGIIWTQIAQMAMGISIKFAELVQKKQNEE